MPLEGLTFLLEAAISPEVRYNDVRDRILAVGDKQSGRWVFLWRKRSDRKMPLEIVIRFGRAVVAQTWPQVLEE